MSISLPQWGLLLKLGLWGLAGFLVVWFIMVPLARRAGLFTETVVVPTGQGGGGSESAASGSPPTTTYQIRTLLSKDAIRAILEPQFVTTVEADASGDMRPGERVIGLSIDGDSRAYPINMLSTHEIVNDVVGGVPVAITW